MSVERRLGRTTWGALLVISTGCAAQPPAAPSVPAAPPPVPALKMAPRAEAPRSTPLHAVLHGFAVVVEGEPIPSNTLSIRGALSRHRNGASSLVLETYEPDDEVLMGVIEAASGTELSQLIVMAGAERYELSVRPRGSVTHEVSNGPEGKLHLTSTSANVGSSGQLDWPLSAPPLELPQPVCGNTCVIQVRHDARGAGAAPLLEMLASLRRLLRDRPDAEIFVQTQSITPEGAPRVKLGAKAVAGRLPPEVIQRIVRQNFEELRKCYEQGLARNANLQGRVQVRFVIGRDGKVSNVTDGGSDLPDQAVRDCVFEGFKTLQFPQPEGGIVTVVYPIMLAPE